MKITSGYGRLVTKVPYTPAIKGAAAELVKRRVLAGVKAEMATALAEAAFMAHYGHDILITELFKSKNYLTFSPTDNDNRVVSLSIGPRVYGNVYSRQLEAEAVAFLVTGSAELDMVGWMSVREIEQSPIRWFENDNGKRYDYCHVVSAAQFAVMPTTFNFVDPCPHLTEYPGVWLYRRMAWECLGCERLLYRADDHNRIEEYDLAHFERPDWLPQKEAESQRSLT